MTAKDIETPGQVEILNPELPIASLTEKSSDLEIEITQPLRDLLAEEVG